MASIMMKFFDIRHVFLASVGVMVLSAVLSAVAQRLDEWAE